MAVFDIDDIDEIFPDQDPFYKTMERLGSIMNSCGLTADCCHCGKPVTFDVYVHTNPIRNIEGQTPAGYVLGGWQTKCPHCGKNIVLTISKHYKDA